MSISVDGSFRNGPQGSRIEIEKRDVATSAHHYHIGFGAIGLPNYLTNA
ncbi:MULTISPECIES: hypothetical protein [unclassified Mycobacteroides]|nr:MULTISPECIES: hypothetical protein [unclassified Mycobacteroides]